MSKVSASQLEMMLDFMVKFGDLSSNSEGRQKTKAKWVQLAQMLHSDASGCIREPTKWVKVWSDWKRRTKKKANAIRYADQATDGETPNTLKLTDIEEKLVNFLGPAVYELNTRKPLISTWICRLCLNEGEKNIFDLEINEKCITSYLDEIANLKVSREDGLPELICEPCLESLNFVVSFKMKCEHSDKYLRNILKKNIGNKNSSHELTTKSQPKNTSNCDDELKDFHLSDHAISDLENPNSQIPKRIGSDNDLKEYLSPEDKFSDSESEDRYSNTQTPILKLKSSENTKVHRSRHSMMNGNVMNSEKRNKYSSTETLVQRYYDIVPTQSPAPDNECILYAFVPKQSSIDKEGAVPSPNSALQTNLQILKMESERKKSRDPLTEVQESYILFPTRVLESSNKDYTLLQKSENCKTIVEKVPENVPINIDESNCKEKSMKLNVMCGTEKVHIKIKRSCEESKNLNAAVQQSRNRETAKPVLSSKEYMQIQKANKIHHEAQLKEKNRRKELDGNINVRSSAQNYRTLYKHKQPRRCIICNTALLSKLEFFEHRRLCLQKFQCWICAKLCNKETLADHINSDHKKPHQTKPEIQMCDICGKIIKGISHLKKHRATHSKELPFMCEKCPYRGRDARFLRLHQRQHTGEKRYACTKCDRRFLTSSNLSIHMLSHIDNKPFKCSDCKWTFKTETRLSQHIKHIHKRIREHKCPVCVKDYGYRKRLLHHMQQKHKEISLKTRPRPLYLRVEHEKSFCK